MDKVSILKVVLDSHHGRDLARVCCPTGPISFLTVESRLRPSPTRLRLSLCWWRYPWMAVLGLLWLGIGCEDEEPRGGDQALDMAVGWNTPDGGDVGDIIESEDATSADVDAEGDPVDDVSDTRTDLEDDEVDSPSSYTGLELTLDTEGGFAGQGSTDIAVADGVMSVHMPYGDPSDCSAALTEGQMAQLLEAAGVFDWGFLAASYRGNNTYCCCDQFAYTFEIELELAGDGSRTVSSQWCSESLDSEEMPAGFISFLGILGQIGAEVLLTCDEPDTQYTDITLDLDTDVGFTGAGGLDYHVHDGAMAVYDPFPEPNTCTADLTQEQMTSLLDAAGRVAWDDVQASYISPENPYCCCDQFVYTFSVTLEAMPTGTHACTSTWCSESFMSGDMPSDFLTFLQALADVGVEVQLTCQDG